MEPTVPQPNLAASPSPTRSDAPTLRRSDAPVQRFNGSTIQRFTLPFLTAFLLALSTLTHAQDSPTNLYQLEAVLIWNVVTYTDWPKQAFTDDRAPFVFGVLGKDPFGKDVDFLTSQKVKGRKVVAKYFSRIEDVQGCHVLFISSSEKDRISQIVKALESSSILTIADFEGFARQNGMINILAAKTRPGFGRLRYEVNQEATERAKLRIDSYVLARASRG